ncbi:MAG: flagellar protein FlaG [Gammaproteobacteria bacterium]|nr:flagellar protein FlaG [Gammaproteobacteria bacterium]
MAGISDLNVGSAAAVVTPPTADKPLRADTGNLLPATGQPEPVPSSSGVLSSATTKTPTDHYTASGETLASTAQAGDAGENTKNVEDVVRDLSNYVQSIGREIQFSRDDTTGRIIVRVIDTATDEVIRQIPSEEIMAFLKNMQELDQEKGNLFEDQV